MSSPAQPQTYLSFPHPICNFATRTSRPAVDTPFPALAIRKHGSFASTPHSSKSGECPLHTLTASLDKLRKTEPHTQSLYLYRHKSNGAPLSPLQSLAMHPPRLQPLHVPSPCSRALPAHPLSNITMPQRRASRPNPFMLPQPIKPMPRRRGRQHTPASPPLRATFTPLA